MILYVHTILIDNQFNWRISQFIIHGRSWITRFLFLAKTMDHAKNSGFSKLWLLWRSSVAFFCPSRFRGFVYCNEMNTCIYIVFTYIPFSLEVNQLIIYTNNFIFSENSNQPTNIFNPLSDCNTGYIHVYVTIRNYNIAEKKLIPRAHFQGCPPPLYSACEIKILQFHNKIRLIVFVPAQISTDDLSIDNLKFFQLSFTKCMPKVFLNDWQNYVKLKHNLFLWFYLNIFYYASPNFLLDSPAIYI